MNCSWSINFLLIQIISCSCNIMVTSSIYSTLQMKACEQCATYFILLFLHNGAVSPFQVQKHERIISSWASVSGMNVVFQQYPIFFALNCLLFIGCEWFLFYVWWGGIHAWEKLSEAFMFPVCSISKAAIKKQLLMSRTLIVVISSFALKTDYHHLALYINYHTAFANVND